MNPFAQFLPTDFSGKLLFFFFFFFHSFRAARPAHPLAALLCCVDVLLVNGLMNGLGLTSDHGGVFGSVYTRFFFYFVIFVIYFLKTL